MEPPDSVPLDRSDWRWLWAILVGALVLRLAAAQVFPNIHHPDEIFQYLEQGHRAVFGSGLIPWEFRTGARSWIFPGALGAVMYACSLVSDNPRVYIGLIRVLLAVLSLAPVAVAYFWALRREGRAAAILAGVLSAVWFELIYFSARTTAGAVAIHVFWIGLFTAYPAREVENRRRLLAGGLLMALAVVVRPQLAPCAVLAALAACRRVRRRWISMLAGVGVMLFLAGALDVVTLTYPLQSVIRNFEANVLYGIASTFGTAPWYAYLVGFADRWGLWAPVLAALFLWGARRERLLSGIGVAIIVSMSVIPHKEYRFVYPAVAFVLVVAAIGAARILHRLSPSLAANGAGVAMIAMLVWSVPSLLLAASYRTSIEDVDRSIDGTFWTVRAGSIEAFLYLHDEPDLCGVGLYGIHWTETSGYTYLHRDVPLVAIGSEAELRGRHYMVNYLLAHPGMEMPGEEFQPVAEFGNRNLVAESVQVLKREGACASAAGADLRLQKID